MMPSHHIVCSSICLEEAQGGACHNEVTFHLNKLKLHSVRTVCITNVQQEQETVSFDIVIEQPPLRATEALSYSRYARNVAMTASTFMFVGDVHPCLLIPGMGERVSMY